MAKLPRSGVGFQILDERHCKLSELVARLGLKPLGKKAERKIRDRLGFALAKWEEPYTAVEVKEVVGALNSHARRLGKLTPLAAAAQTGMARSDEIAVSAQLVQSLSQNPTIGSVGAAQSFLGEFCDRARTIALACRVAAIQLGFTEGKSGNPRFDWYDEFTAVVVQVCQQNNIEPKLGIDRSSGNPKSRFAEVVAEFERLLLPKMRSPTLQAMAKRLQRSLRRLQLRSQAGAE
jgi:hypothetical protein